MNLEVLIQHHPSRWRLLDRLIPSLGGLASITVIVDGVPDGPPDAWRTHKAALESIRSDATHALVIQDDALPVPGFHEKILTAIEEKPESLLLAFVPGFPRERKNMNDATNAGARYYRFRAGAYVPTVATVYPRDVAIDLLAWAETGGGRVGDRYRRPMQGADDGILANYCRARRLQPIALVPSIVEHDETIPKVGSHARLGPHRRAAMLERTAESASSA